MIGQKVEFKGSVWTVYAVKFNYLILVNGDKVDGVPVGSKQIKVI